MLGYRALDIGFFVFHSALILFILFGWVWRKTRKPNLVAILLTAFSWFILGIWYGFGYCPCTHWHWLVREQLGRHDMPRSYIKFLIDSLTGWDVDAMSVDIATAAAFFLASLASVQANLRGKRQPSPGPRECSGWPNQEKKCTPP